MAFFLSVFQQRRGAETARANCFAFILRYVLHSTYFFQSGRLCAACGRFCRS